MNKLIISMAAAAALAAGGAAFAQGGTEGQTGFTWGGGNQNYDNLGGTPPAYAYGGLDAWGRPIYYGVPYAASIYPPAAAVYPPAAAVHPPKYGDRYARTDRGDRQRSIARDARRGDRDGDGVPDNRDRYPDDSRRW